MDRNKNNLKTNYDWKTIFFAKERILFHFSPIFSMYFQLKYITLIHNARNVPVHVMHFAYRAN